MDELEEIFKRIAEREPAEQKVPGSERAENKQRDEDDDLKSRDRSRS